MYHILDNLLCIIKLIILFYKMCVNKSFNCLYKELLIIFMQYVGKYVISKFFDTP